MKIINKIKKYFEVKSSNYSNMQSHFFTLNDATWTIKDFQKLAQEGYCKNVIVHRAITLITQSAASVPWKLYKIQNDKKIEIINHPLLNLLHKPNPNLAGAEFFENVFAYKLISGNAYIHALGYKNERPRELHILRPDRVTIIPGDKNIAQSYVYKVNSSETIYPVDKITGQSRLLHIRNFNPLDDWYGMSSIEAAAYAIDQHNQAAIWNQSLLQNGARPSGALVLKSSDNNYFLKEEDMDNLKQEITDAFCGMRKAGRPLLLQGGLEWQEMSMSPKDMDFIEAKNVSAREIALALGVPPQLLGIPGDNKYSNMQEARLALWEETILPMLDHLIDSLNNWLVPMFGNDLKLSYDIDEINGLTARREKIWSRVENASFLTINEKRKIVGLSPIKNGDQL